MSDDGYRSNWQRQRAGVPLKPEGFSRESSTKELPALTQQLATLRASHNSKHNSLRELAQTAIDCPGKYLPSYLHPAELRTSREAWYTGFVEAMTLVLKHIDSAPPPPRHGTQSKRW